MKIAIDARTLMDKRFSGVSEYTFNLTRELLSQDASDEFLLFYNAWKEVDFPRFDYPNAKIVRYRYPNKVFNYLLQKTLKRPKLDRRLGTDVFFLPHLNFASFERPERTVLTIHDLSFLRFPRFFSLRKNCWHKLLAVKALARRCGRLVAVSQNTKRDLVELLGIEEKKIQVIYSGLAPGFAPVDKSDAKLAAIRRKYALPEKFILFLGTVEPRKNLSGLIGAYEKMIGNEPAMTGYKLLIAGGHGWKTAGIVDRWNQSKAKENISFLGYVDTADKKYLYNLASLFVYPSFYEGFGFPPLEAMACGTPVVTSDCSSLPEIAGAAALLFDPFDETDMARSMSLVLGDGRLAARLSAEGLKRAALFSWPLATRSYLDLFRSLA